MRRKRYYRIISSILILVIFITNIPDLGLAIKVLANPAIDTVETIGSEDSDQEKRNAESEVSESELSTAVEKPIKRDMVSQRAEYEPIVPVKMDEPEVYKVVVEEDIILENTTVAEPTMYKGNVTVRGTVDFTHIRIQGNLSLEGNQVSLTGGVGKVAEKLLVEGNLYQRKDVKNAKVDCQEMIVNGNAILESGQSVFPNLVIKGDLRIQSIVGEEIYGDSPASISNIAGPQVIAVLGDFYTQSMSKENYFKLELYGSFYLLGESYFKGTVAFVGSEEQHVSFETRDKRKAEITSLIVINEHEKIYLDTPIPYVGLTHNTVFAGEFVEIISMGMNEHDLTIEGTWLVCQEQPENIITPAGTIYVENDLRIQSYQEDGSFGETSTGFNRWDYFSSQVVVKGDFYSQSTNRHNSAPNNGLTLYGNLHQIDDTYFNDDGDIIFAGEEQHVVFENQNNLFKTSYVTSGSLYLDSPIFSARFEQNITLIGEYIQLKYLYNAGSEVIIQGTLLVPGDMNISAKRVLVTDDFRIEKRNEDGSFGETNYGHIYYQSNGDVDEIEVMGSFYSNIIPEGAKTTNFLTSYSLVLHEDYIVKGASCRNWYFEERYPVIFAGEGIQNVSINPLNWNQQFYYIQNKSCTGLQVDAKATSLHYLSSTTIEGDLNAALRGEGYNTAHVKGNMLNSIALPGSGVIQIDGDWTTQSREININDDGVLKVRGNLNLKLATWPFSVSQTNGLLDISGNINMESGILFEVSGSARLHLSNYQQQQITTDNNASFRISNLGITRTGTYSYPERFRYTNLYYIEDMGKVLAERQMGETNLASGNYSKGFSALTTQSSVGVLDITLTYNSLNEKEGVLGRGFTYGLNMKIESEENDFYKTKIVTLANGARCTFKEVKAGVYTALDSRNTLTLINENYILKTKENNIYTFSRKGHILSMEDRIGNKLTYEVNEKGDITSIHDVTGTDIAVSYDNGKVVSIRDQVTGDEASFSYQDGKLTKMVDYLGKNTWFEYQENDLLSRIYNHDESIFQDITYYSEEPHARKMKSVTNTAGNTETYTYDDNRPLTTITDSNGRMRMESFDREGFLLQSTDAEGNKTTQQYNYVNSKNYGEISRSIDGCGNITSYLYDSQGRVYKVTYPDDSIEMTTYDKYGNVIAMCSRTGAYTYYFYDEDGKNLLQEIRPVKKGLRYSDSEDQSLFAITTYTYDEEHAVKGLVKSKTLPLGDKDNYIIYSHNYKGQVVKETRFIDSVPYETTYEYNNRKLPVREIAPDGVTTEYTYNLTSEMVRKKILSSDHHQQSVSGVVYDEMGRKVLEISPIEYDTEHDQLDQGIYTGVGTMHTYDTSGNVLTTTDALGLKIQYTYDLYGNVIKEQMPDGSYTEFRYDSIDRLVAEYFYDVVEDNLTTKNLTYDQSGKNIKTTEVVSDGRSTKTTVTEIDFEGKLISEEVNGRKHQRTYLKGGILYQETDPSSRMTTYEYDGMDQIICKTESFESNSRAITVYTYDQGGNILSEEIYDNKVGEDPSSSRKTEYIYDKWGRAISQIFYSRGEPARYQQVSYDSKGRIKAQYKGLHKPLKINGETVTDSGDSEYSIIKFEYNYLDKKVKEIDALGRVTTYSYDAAGNIIASQTGEKFYAAVYDIKGNVLSETTSIAGEDAIEKTYEYDVLGRLTAGTYQGVQESYSYNGRSQLIRKERESTVSEFQYDFREALLSSNVYVNGVLQQQTINTYNSTGDLESVSDENGRIVQYQYDDGGRVILTRFSNGISEVREYNYAGLPKKISNQDSTGNEISSYEYSYFVDGSTYKINHAGGTTEYQYDGMNQLIAETHTSGSDVTSITYAYDDNGNQLEKIINSPSGSDGSKYQYDKLDQLTKEMKIKGETTTYTYDVYGNMVAKKSNSKTEEQQFDALNHLVYWSDGSSEADYCYDINGLRIAKIVDGQETKHIWAGNHIAVDIGPEGTIKYTYGSELVKSDYGIYLYNGHGDVVQLVNDGKVTSRYDYSAYGAPLDKISEYTGDANPYRYTAQYRDSETGYYYLRARYYDSELSRFINQDPIKDGSNWHVYGGDNPVANNDTTGLFFEKVWKKAKSAGRDFISASEKAVKTVGSVGNKVINKVKDFASTNVGRVVIGTTIIGLAAIATVATGGAAGGLAGAIAAGALKGAIVGAAMGAASGGAVGFVSHVMETGSLEGAGKATLDAATKGFMGGAITGAITGGIKGGISYHPKAAPSNIQKAVQSGKEGEFELKQLVGGESQKHFSTSDGARYVDQFAKGVAHESKVGYTSLTKSIRRQILKDTELIASGDIKGAVWHFFKSSVTGKGGASQPLTNFLIENGIKIMNHF